MSTEAEASTVSDASFDLEAREEAALIPYWEADILRYLYEELELTQPEIAERYDTTATSVSRWMGTHGIETRQGKGSFYFKEGRATEYPVFAHGHEGKSETIRIHRLLACVDNDPHEVFASGKHCHHRLAAPVAINARGNVELLDPGKHRRRHAEGDLAEDPEDVGIGGGDDG